MLVAKIMIAGAPAPHRAGPRALPWLRIAAVYAGYVALTLLLQYLGGAYGGQGVMAGDEPAHLMSGLLVRDYAVHGLPESPLGFARRFYASHPTLGIGYWPPLFYATQAAWMLAAGVSRESLLVLLALLSAGVSLAIYRFAEQEFGSASAVLLGAAFALLPAVQTANRSVTSDVFVTLLSIPALLAFARFLDSPSGRGGFVFGFLTGLSLLAKLSSAYLVLMVLLAIGASGRWRLLRHPGLWIAAATALLVAGPWFWLARDFWNRGLLPPGSGPGLGEVWLGVASPFLRAAGPVLLLAAAAGVALLIPRRHGYIRWVPVLAQPFAFAIFLGMAPVFPEVRYVILALPCLLLLAGFAIRRLAPNRAATTAAIALLAIALPWTAPAPGSELATPGIRETARELVRLAGPQAVILVSSQDSEGAMVAELALLEPRRPGRAVLRATKLLVDTDWNVTRYQLRFGRSGEVLRELDARGIEFVLLDDSSPAKPGRAHHDQLWEALRQDPNRWEAVHPAGAVSLYRRVPGVPPPSV